MKGSNKLTSDEIQNYYLFNDNNQKYDITVIVGCKNSVDSTGQLLLMRFNNYNPVLSKKKKQNVQNLFNDLVYLLKNDGLERRRQGGSSGKISYSKNLMKLMSTHNCTPRKSKGMLDIIFLQKIIYIYPFF